MPVCIRVLLFSLPLCITLCAVLWGQTVFSGADCKCDSILNVLYVSITLGLAFLFFFFPILQLQHWGVCTLAMFHVISCYIGEPCLTEQPLESTTQEKRVLFGFQLCEAFLSDLPFWVRPRAAWVNLFVNDWLIIKGWRAYDSQSRHTRTLTLHLYLGTFIPPLHLKKWSAFISYTVCRRQESPSSEMPLQ